MFPNKFTGSANNPNQNNNAYNFPMNVNIPPQMPPMQYQFSPTNVSFPYFNTYHTQMMPNNLIPYQNPSQIQTNPMVFTPMFPTYMPQQFMQPVFMPNVMMNNMNMTNMNLQHKTGMNNPNFVNRSTN